MKKLKLYLDTSVISYLDQPERRELHRDTHRLWAKLKSGEYDVFISNTTIDELERCKEPKRTRLADYLNEIAFTVIPSDTVVEQVAGKFIDFGILKEKSFDDCQHIAAALISNCDVIISWNFRHIVNLNTMRGVKLVATAEGYRDLLICAPNVLLGGEPDDETP
jgi:predicted nucleic acid-binding protein